LITGGNRGIGKEIARLIGSEPGYTAIIACRDVELGRLAAEEMRNNPSPRDHDHDHDYDDDDKADVGECDVVSSPYPFDLTDLESIRRTVRWINDEYPHDDGGGEGILDVLVNNAAVCYNDPTLYGKTRYTPFKEQARITLDTNYVGTLHVIEECLPLLMRSDMPRIINVASYAGRLTILRSPHLVERFTSDELTITELSDMMDEFVTSVEDGTHEGKGWPNTCYGISKLGIIALTRVLSRKYPNMMINSVDPGYCRTDQNDNTGTVDPIRGARTPYLLALMERGRGDDDVEYYDDEDDADDGEGDGGGDSNDDLEDDDEDEEVEVDSGLHFYEESEISWTYQSQ
jgi:carbonyl reductase 1